MSDELIELMNLRAQAEWSMLMKRADTPAWVKAWQARQRWDARWSRQIFTRMTAVDQKNDVRDLVKTAQKLWGRRPLGKQRRPENVPDPDEVTAKLAPATAFSTGAMATYLSLSADEGEDSGQMTLDALGLNHTFAWAGKRDFPANTFAVRGSKILTQSYDNHREQLAKMVVRKCDPAQPKTIGELTREIRSEWSTLTAKQARRIARTESAYVWETTNWNAMLLNGVQQVEWLVASGPRIGPPKSYPVCETCLELAANSPYVIDDMEVIPPVHPHDRCTLVPKYDPKWLPPAEPWTGAETKMEIFQ